MPGLLSAALALAQAVASAGGQPICEGHRCVATLSAPELLKAAERLVLARRYAEAAPLIAALANAPGFTMEAQFLEGFVAVETGDPKTAVARFRAILAKRPELVRVRLELARALAMLGKDTAADHHFRLAEEADLPPEIERTIYASRSLIRDRKRWELNVSAGLAPDTNINSATSDRIVDVHLGGSTLPLELDEQARRRSGIGQTGAAWGSYRMGDLRGVAWLFEGDARGVNYAGTAADDLSILAAAGPEWRVGDRRAALAATASQRWYGGDIAQRLVGVRASAQKEFSGGARGGVQIDARRVESGIDRAYDGWAIAGTVTYERVVRRSLLAAITGFARWDPLRSAAYSNTETGIAVGIGGELPRGLNGGVSASLSRAEYDAVLPIFDEGRKEWRPSARVYLGVRSLRVAGFSPSVAYTYTGNHSTVGLYDFNRHRLEFQLARYF